MSGWAERAAELVRDEPDPAFRRRVITVMEWLEPRSGQRILDCGTGRAFYLRYLRALGASSLVGLEVESASLERAAHSLAGQGAGIHLVRGRLPEIPFASGSFDAAVLSEVLEHVPDDAGALRDLRRVLRPGGLAAITVPNRDYPFWWDPINRTLERLLGTRIRRGPLAGIWAHHLRLYAARDLRELVEGSGFEVLRERSFTHHCLPFSHNLLYGLGKPLLEGGWLPERLGASIDRSRFDRRPERRPWAARAALAVLDRFDARNRMDEPPGRSTVNLCLLARRRG